MGAAEANERGAGWWVQAAGKVYGPYPYTRIEDFVVEGRVAAETLMAPRPEGPFLPAGRQAGLLRLFGDLEPDLDGPLAASLDEPVRPTYAMLARPLLVWTRLKSQAPERFEQALAVHGPFAAIAPGLWLVRARMGPAALRNALTRRLDSNDALMVVEAPLNQAHWFNIDGETDRTLRQLWGERSED